MPPNDESVNKNIKPPKHLYEEEPDQSAQQHDDDDGPMTIGMWIGAAVFLISIILLIVLIITLFLKK